jgi:hypothetical protein
MFSKDVVLLFDFVKSRQSNLCFRTTDIWTLSLEQIQLARKYGIIDTFPNMSKEDLDAVSNSDGLAKALAVCQVFWLIIQMISRATSGLAVCQLEVATGAFAITTFLTYLFLWQKPQGVSRPIYLEAVRRPTIGEAWELAQSGLEETIPSWWFAQQRSEQCIALPGTLSFLGESRCGHGEVARWALHCYHFSC